MLILLDPNENQQAEPIPEMNEEKIAERILSYQIQTQKHKDCFGKLMEKMFSNLQSSFFFSNESLFFHPICVLNFLFYDPSWKDFVQNFQRNKRKMEALILQNCFGGKITVKRVEQESVFLIFLLIYLDKFLMAYSNYLDFRIKLFYISLLISL